MTQPKAPKFIASILLLCAACCTIPAGVIALGIAGTASAAYLSIELKAATLTAIVLGATYLYARYRRPQC